MKIKNARIKAGLTQCQLAEKTNIPIRTIRAYEQGTRSIDKSNISHVILIAHALECRLEDMVEDKENIMMLKEMYKK